MNIALSAIIQLSTLHSYDEVKIVCINSKEIHEKLEWIKRLPHVWGPEKSIRFMASSRDEARDVLLYLNEVLSEREESVKDNYSNQNNVILPHFVVFISEPELVENEPVMRFLSNSNASLELQLCLYMINSVCFQRSVILLFSVQSQSVFYIIGQS